ncbi:hypothetical protein DFJ69_1681 [Thermomonospora umbrina]|uniref:Uncharacterized protein n=1 Tax=Thermomonospora umbrina TaxID=111806 RepID=A0A3D9SXC0_9ACTN|nr:hypothetical protein DFJ69_1681 [Thermomonospora umbrina]
MARRPLLRRFAALFRRRRKKRDNDSSIYPMF